MGAIAQGLGVLGQLQRQEEQRLEMQELQREWAQKQQDDLERKKIMGELGQLLTPPKQGGGPGGAPSMPPGAPSMPPQAAIPAPPPGAAPAGGMGGAPMPAQWKPSPIAPPALGGQPQPPGGGMPQLGAPPTAPSVSGTFNVDDFVKKMDAQGIPMEHRYPILERMLPIVESQNKEKAQHYKDQLEAIKLATEYMKARTAERTAAGEGPFKGDFFSALRAKYGEGWQKNPEAQKELTAYIKRKDAPARSTINVGTGAGALTEDAKRLAAEQYLATGNLPAMYRDQKGRAEIMDLAAKIKKEKGGDLSDVPGERATFKADAASLTQRQRFVDAGNQFIKNLQKQADLVDSLMAKGAAGGVPVLNKWIQAGRKGLAGDPDVTALDTAIRGMAREHQRIVTGVTSNAQLHVAAQQTADELLNVAQTPQQMKAAIKVMREEAKNAIAAGNEEVADIRARMKGTTSDTKPKTIKWSDLP